MLNYLSMNKQGGGMAQKRQEQGLTGLKYRYFKQT